MLDEAQRAALVRHLDECSSCRTAQAGLAAAAIAWRKTDATVVTPAVETEWQAIRRQIHQEAPPAGASVFWRRPMAWSLSAAAAALAVAALVGTGWWQSRAAANLEDSTYVSFVEVHGATDSTMVYEDQQNNCLVVWVGDADAALGS